MAQRKDFYNFKGTNTIVKIEDTDKQVIKEEKDDGNCVLATAQYHTLGISHKELYK